jgi:hypothetical protein
MRGRGEGGGWRGGMGGEGSEGKGRKGGEGRGGKERGGKGRKGEGRGGNWVRSGSFSFTKSSLAKSIKESLLCSQPDCTEVFFDHLIREQRRISNIMNRIIAALPLARK